MSALLQCVTHYARHGYPTWRFANDPTATDSETKVGLLVFSVFAGHRRNAWKGFDWSALDAPLSQGLLTSTTQTQLVLVEDNPRSLNDLYTFSPYDNAVIGETELSVWYQCLLTEWLAYMDGFRSSGLSRQEAKTRFAEVVKRFLSYGAVKGERDLAASVSTTEKDKARLQFTLQCNPSNETRTASCWTTRPAWVYEEMFREAKPLFPAVMDKREKISAIWSLRSWISQLEGVPNKEKLLRL